MRAKKLKEAQPKSSPPPVEDGLKAAAVDGEKTEGGKKVRSRVPGPARPSRRFPW